MSRSFRPHCKQHMNGIGYLWISQHLCCPMNIIKPIICKAITQHSADHAQELLEGVKSALRAQDHSKRALERARSCGDSCHSNGQCIPQPLSLFLLTKKTLLLNKACLKFAIRHLKKPFDYCENAACSDETKNKSKAPCLALHMTFEIS